MKAAPIPFPNRATTFGFVLVAAAVNVSAFAFELFERISWIDKALHAFTGFVATLAALYFLRDHLDDAIARMPRNVVLACAAFGLAIGLGWELLVTPPGRPAITHATRARRSSTITATTRSS